MQLFYLTNSAGSILIAFKDYSTGGFYVYNVEEMSAGMQPEFVSTTLARYEYASTPYRMTEMTISMQITGDVIRARMQTLLTLKRQDSVLFRIMLMNKSNLCRWLSGDIQADFHGSFVSWLSADGSPLDGEEIWRLTKRKKSPGDPALPHSTFWINGVRGIALPWALVSDKTEAAQAAEDIDKSVNVANKVREGVAITGSIAKSLTQMGLNQAGVIISGAQLSTEVAQQKPWDPWSTNGGPLASFAKFFIRAAGHGTYTPGIAIEYLKAEQGEPSWYWGDYNIFVYMVPVSKHYTYGYPVNDGEDWKDNNQPVDMDSWKSDAILAWQQAVKKHE